jgi:EAL domain-containing protein (putative c-di-GMP-specific phosphodiesterase class I)/GGDEF domain-containing protein
MGSNLIRLATSLLRFISQGKSYPKILSKNQFFKRLEKVLADQQPSSIVALLVISLARSDSVDAILQNATAREIGTQILARIRLCLRRQDHMAMASHDEVWILLPNIASPTLASVAANNIINELDTPFLHHGAVVTVRPCIGIAVLMEPGKTPLGALKSAAQAKNRSRVLNLPYFVATVAENPDLLSMDLIVALETALAQNSLLLVYQPKVDVRSMRVVSVEALIRLPPEMEAVMTPTMLVGIAEEFGMIQQLTSHVLHTALREHAAHLAQCGIDRVWINLSAKMLNDPNLPEFLTQALEVWNASPQVLGLEITESMLITDIDQSVTMLDHLAGLGFSLAMDDFGTGYSSLAYLRRLPINELKIDKTFVKHMASTVADRQIVQTIIDLSHKFDLQVVAEGAEDLPTLALLEQMGCDQVQGYIFAKAMSASLLADWSRSFHIKHRGPEPQ